MLEGKRRFLFEILKCPSQLAFLKKLSEAKTKSQRKTKTEPVKSSEKSKFLSHFLDFSKNSNPNAAKIAAEKLETNIIRVGTEFEIKGMLSE